MLAKSLVTPSPFVMGLGFGCRLPLLESGGLAAFVELQKEGAATRVFLLHMPSPQLDMLLPKVTSRPSNLLSGSFRGWSIDYVERVSWS